MRELFPAQKKCLITLKGRVSKMGKKKHLGEIEKLFMKSPVVDAASISRIVGSRKKEKQYYKQLIRNLVIKGKVKRLSKGFYTRHNEISLAVFCFKPAYLGLQDALSFHDFGEQETIPVILTARMARNGIRQVSGANILIRRIDKKYLFGYKYMKQGSFYFPVSDIEKTFIDMVYFREKIDTDLLISIKKSVDKRKLESYLSRYPERLRAKILKIMA